MKSKEEIKNLLLEKFHSVYCDTCKYKGYDEEHCDYCSRKSMQWEISEEFADTLAGEIIA